MIHSTSLLLYSVFWVSLLPSPSDAQPLVDGTTCSPSPTKRPKQATAEPSFYLWRV